MDTAFAVSIVSQDEPLAAAAAATAFARIDELELLLSKFNDTSDVAVIRALKPGETAVIAPETMAILVLSAEVAAATGGAFDPTLGKGFNRLVLDREHLRAAVKPDADGNAAPLELDFGGIGKGFALDECRAILVGEQFGFTDFLLDAGTSTVWAEGGPWPLGVGGRWKARTRRETVLRLSGAALSGSGTELQGEHIVDPRRGIPARRWEQTWARLGSAAIADALSTAAISMTAREIAAACNALDSMVLVARRQPQAFDRFRDPLARFEG